MQRAQLPVAAKKGRVKAARRGPFGRRADEPASRHWHVPTLDLELSRRFEPEGVCGRVGRPLCHEDRARFRGLFEASGDVHGVAGQEALIQPTGGTTGSPKSVVLTHRNLLANALQLKAWNGAAEGRDLVLAVIPFFHCYGLTVVMLGTIAGAGTLLLCPRFKPRTLARLIERHFVLLPDSLATFQVWRRLIVAHCRATAPPIYFAASRLG